MVVAHLRGAAVVSQRLAEIQTRYLSTVALGELHYGIHRSSRPDASLRQFERWLRVAVLLPISPVTAEHHGRLKDQLARAGTPLRAGREWLKVLGPHRLLFILAAFGTQSIVICLLE